jgi:hypothetical protein
VFNTGACVTQQGARSQVLNKRIVYFADPAGGDSGRDVGARLVCGVVVAREHLKGRNA